jgi:hypothetical protein
VADAVPVQLGCVWPGLEHEVDEPFRVSGTFKSEEEQLVDAALIKGVLTRMIDGDGDKACVGEGSGSIVVYAEPATPTVGNER